MTQKTPSENDSVDPSVHSPMKSLEDWEDFVTARYAEIDGVAPPKAAPPKAKEEFRNYDNPGRDTVREFYWLNHKHQTRDFVLGKKKEFLALKKREMNVWEAADFLNTLVDDSDPDISLTQLQHLLQTSEAIRADGHPDWFVLTGFLHDLGKILCLFGEPQWAVVGDTFPVGCAFSDKIVDSEFFSENPDSQVPWYQTRCGVYDDGCGLSNVDVSWHCEGAYDHLMNDHDRERFQWVRAFNPYDLYSKCPTPPDVEKLRPYYDQLIKKYLPAKLSW